MRRIAIEIVAALLAIVGFALFERHRGAQKCIADNKEVAQEQRAKDAEVRGAQTVQVQHEARVYRDETTKPITDAPVVRVCPRPSPVPAPSAAGSVDHEPTELPRMDPEVPASSEWDSTGVVQAGRDADAQVKALEDYINNVCLRKGARL